MHEKEQARIGSAKSGMDYSAVPPPTTYFAPDQLSVVKAKHLAGMLYDMDLTAMNGPVSAHERFTVVVK